MNEYHLCDDGSGNMATEYPKCDNNGSVSDASPIPKNDGHLKEGLGEVAELNHTENPKLARALAVIKEYCAIGQESKSAEDGRQALGHTRAVRMAIFNVEERDNSNVRVILASFGIFAVDMADIDAMLMRWGFLIRRDIIGTLMTGDPRAWHIHVQEDCGANSEHGGGTGSRPCATPPHMVAIRFHPRALNWPHNILGHLLRVAFQLLFLPLHPFMHLRCPGGGGAFQAPLGLLR
jgi:hypothetical protein